MVENKSYNIGEARNNHAYKKELTMVTFLAYGREGGIRWSARWQGCWRSTRVFGHNGVVHDEWVLKNWSASRWIKEAERWRFVRKGGRKIREGERREKWERVGEVKMNYK